MYVFNLALETLQFHSNRMLHWIPCLSFIKTFITYWLFPIKACMDCSVVSTLCIVPSSPYIADGSGELPTRVSILDSDFSGSASEWDASTSFSSFCHYNNTGFAALTKMWLAKVCQPGGATLPVKQTVILSFDKYLRVCNLFSSAL